jgi:hypothetical protein
MNIRNLTQTCGFCPSQWEAKDEEGNDIYIRYRWGTLEVDKNGKMVFKEQIGGKLDGFMETEEMLLHTKLKII